MTAFAHLGLPIIMTLSPATVTRRATLHVPVTAVFNAGYKLLAGVDEVGAGALAGPVVAAAVSLKQSSKPFYIPDLDDSKSLSKRKRDKVYQSLIDSDQLTYSLCLIPSNIIDQINILNARLAAMQQAIKKLKQQPDMIFVDGDKPLPEIDQKRQLVMVNGDSRVSLIAAASVIAKVTRDRLMMVEAKRFPQYRFENHFGYGTKTHLEMLQIYGPCQLHRFSYKPVANAEKRFAERKNDIQTT